MNPLISFVIPVYKVERYLGQCVESILCQTYSNIEVILVDDGSPDGCPQICDEYANNDTRIKVIHKQNGGLSDARNMGLQHVSGDFVIFVDSDDFWSTKEDLSEIVSLLVEQDLDFLGFNFSYYYSENNSEKYKSYPKSLSMPLDGEHALIQSVGNGDLPMSAWNKVINVDFLRQNGLFFRKGILAEDIPWFINVLEKTKKCIFVNKYIYNYRQNVATSITASGGQRSFDNLFEIVKTEIDLLPSRSFSKNAKNHLLSFLAYEYCILLLKAESFKGKRRTESLRQLKEYKWLLDYPQNPKVKMASRCFHILGYSLTSKLLFIYRKFQNLRKR